MKHAPALLVLLAAVAMATGCSLAASTASAVGDRAYDRLASEIDAACDLPADRRALFFARLQERTSADVQAIACPGD